MGAQIPRLAIVGELSRLPPTPEIEEAETGLFQRLLANTLRIERDALTADMRRVETRCRAAIEQLGILVDALSVEFDAVLKVRSLPQLGRASDSFADGTG